MGINKSNESFGNKLQDLVQTFQGELKKTTQIGMKMISASQSNSELKESYEQLGILVVQAIKNDDLKWENKETHRLIKKIDNLKKQLTSLEDDLHTIKQDD